MTACAHTFRSLIQCFQKVCSCNCIWILCIIGKTGFSLLLFIFCHIMHIYIGLHVQNLIHVLSIMIQQNLWSHSLLCCTFYIVFLYMSVTTLTCNFLLQLYVAAFAYVRVGFLWFCHFSYVVFQWEVFVHIKFQCAHFFLIFMHVRHITRDSLQIALWLLLHVMFCSSFSFIWLTIVFCPYFVLSKVRNLSVGTVLQWIHFCCDSLEVNLMCDATLFIGMISCNKCLSHFLQMYCLDVGVENLLDSASTITVLSNCTLILWIWYIAILVHHFYGNMYTDSNLSM